MLIHNETMSVRLKNHDHIFLPRDIQHTYSNFAVVLKLREGLKLNEIYFYNISILF